MLQRTDASGRAVHHTPFHTLVALTTVDELAADERADVIAAATAAVAPPPLRVTSARMHEGVEELKRELLTRTGLVGGVVPRPGGVRLGKPIEPQTSQSRCW